MERAKLFNGVFDGYKLKQIDIYKIKNGLRCTPTANGSIIGLIPSFPEGIAQAFTLL